MASNLRKFERTFVFCEFVCQHYKIGYRTSAANFFPPLLCHVTGMRTKVKMIDFVLVVIVVVGSHRRVHSTPSPSYMHPTCLKNISFLLNLWM